MSAIVESVNPQPAPAASTRPLWVAVGVLSVAVLGMGGMLIHGQMANPPAASGNPPAMAAASGEAGPATAVATPSVKTAEPTKAEEPATHKPVKAPQVAAKAPANAPPVTVAQAPVTVQAPARPVCGNCGWVESVQQVQQAGHPVGVGAVAGGVLGAVVGNQVGGGNGRTIATVLGAVGGGLAGNEVEKKMKKTTHYEVRVRMEDGSLRTFEQANPIGNGERVVVENGVLRPAPQPDMPVNGVPGATGKVYSTQ